MRLPAACAGREVTFQSRTLNSIHELGYRGDPHIFVLMKDLDVGGRWVVRTRLVALHEVSPDVVSNDLVLV